jgi:tetratricopeptide (TPR) repeat protein
MFQLKTISPGAVPAALERAHRYRLLNDPSAAESICLDVLGVDAQNQQALVTLLLARTDQFGETMAGAVARAKEVLPRLAEPYQREYYAGVIAERRAKALVSHGKPGSAAMAYDAFREAMDHYEAAEQVAPGGHDEARLRWNTCARILNDDPTLSPQPEERYEPALED